MAGMIVGPHFFLLQRVIYKQDNPMDGIMFVVAIIAIVVISIVSRILIRVFGSGGSNSKSGKGSRRSSVTPRKFNAFSIMRIASSYGLDREQAKLLEFVFRNDGVTDPDRTIKNQDTLDRSFKKAFRSIEKNSANDEESQLRLQKLFNLRNTIEAASPDGDGESSVRLTDNTSIILTLGKNKYPVKVLISKGQTIVVEMPKNALGTPIRFDKGTPASLSVLSESSGGYSLDCQIVGSGNTAHGPGLQLRSAGKTKPLAKRKFRRKRTEIRCEFYHVHSEESGTGRHKSLKLVVDNKKFTGTVQDISVGGCSIKTISPIQAGARLKINIEHDNQFQISVLGQIIRINRSGGSSIAHIKFLKVPRRAFNSISADVFGYSEN